MLLSSLWWKHFPASLTKASRSQLGDMFIKRIRRQDHTHPVITQLYLGHLANIFGFFSNTIVTLHLGLLQNFSNPRTVVRTSLCSAGSFRVLGRRCPFPKCSHTNTQRNYVKHLFICCMHNKGPAVCRHEWPLVKGLSNEQTFSWIICPMSPDCIAGNTAVMWHWLCFGVKH